MGFQTAYMARAAPGRGQVSGEIVAAAVTTNDLRDGQLLPELLDRIDTPIVRVSSAGPYDTRGCNTVGDQYQAWAAIPPRRGARIWQHGNSDDPPLARDENLRYIRRMGRAAWKRVSGYHRRSLAETAMFRIKTLFGERARTQLCGTSGRDAHPLQRVEPDDSLRHAQ